MKSKAFILLDKSGSMSSIWSEAISGINTYVKRLELPDIEVMVAAFDSSEYVVVRNTTVKDYKDITNNEISPGALTPLLDSTGRIIWNMLDSGVDRAMLVIVTDGYENTSRKFTKTEINKLISDIEKSENRDVVFLGANFDKIDDLAKNTLGSNDASRSINTTNKTFVNTMDFTASATRAYLGGGSKATMFYNDEDKIKSNKK